MSQTLLVCLATAALIAVVEAGSTIYPSKAPLARRMALSADKISPGKLVGKATTNSKATAAAVASLQLRQAQSSCVFNFNVTNSRAGITDLCSGSSQLDSLRAGTAAALYTLRRPKYFCRGTTLTGATQTTLAAAAMQSRLRIGASMLLLRMT